MIRTSDLALMVRRLSNNRSSESGDLVEEPHSIYRKFASDSARLKAWLAEKVPEHRYGMFANQGVRNIISTLR